MSCQHRERGRAFGFHRSADTLGAAIGPLVALFILNMTGGDLRAVFGWTLVPGALAVAVALIFLRDRRRRRAPAPITANPPTAAAAKVDRSVSREGRAGRALLAL